MKTGRSISISPRRKRSGRPRVPRLRLPINFNRNGISFSLYPVAFPSMVGSRWRAQFISTLRVEALISASAAVWEVEKLAPLRIVHQRLHGPTRRPRHCIMCMSRQQISYLLQKIMNKESRISKRANIAAELAELAMKYQTVLIANGPSSRVHHDGDH